MNLLALATSSFLPRPPPTVTLRSTGQTATVFGTGPPVVFSSGLFGTMPRRLYTKLFAEMTPHVSLVVPTSAAPVTSDVVEDIADALAVDSVGFFSHSSFRSDILSSSRVHRAVLCDPVVMPQIGWTGAGLSMENAADVASDVLILRAGRAYDAASTTPIPDFLTPRTDEASSRVVDFDDMGHADLLDDTWAELGPVALPWMRGATGRRVGFHEWSFGHAGNLDELRAEYRREVARLAVRHLLDDDNSEPTTHGVLVEA